MDQKLFLFIHSPVGKSKVLDFFGIFFSDYLGYFILTAVIFAVWSLLGDWKKKFHFFTLIALSTILSRGILTEAIRFFYYRPRPFLALNFQPLIGEMNEGAFPSGHMAFYLALVLPIFLINKKWGWYMVGAASVMGFARVFVGVHWPSDILGGAAVAIISFYLVERLLSLN